MQTAISPKPENSRPGAPYPPPSSFAPKTDEYLGRLCHFGECPKGKPECLVKDCDASKFLRQIEGFAFDPDALSAAKAITLFERGTSTNNGSLDDWKQLPF